MNPYLLKHKWRNTFVSVESFRAIHEFNTSLKRLRDEKENMEIVFTCNETIFRKKGRKSEQDKWEFFSPHL